MKPLFALGLGALLGVAISNLPLIAAHAHMAINHGRSNASGTDQPKVLHTLQTFSLVAKAPMQVVAPLLGADKERAWSPGWNPEFLWPTEPSDRPGMVFTVAHGHKTVVWVNTTFDLDRGRIQYVYVIPDIMVTLITLTVTPEGQQTRVAVEYARTALNPDANDLVQQQADKDATEGPEWEKQINDHLKGSAQ